MEDARKYGFLRRWWCLVQQDFGSTQAGRWDLGQSAKHGDCRRRPRPTAAFLPDNPNTGITAKKILLSPKTAAG